MRNLIRLYSIHKDLKDYWLNKNKKIVMVDLVRFEKIIEQLYCIDFFSCMLKNTKIFYEFYKSNIIFITILHDLIK